LEIPPPSKHGFYITLAGSQAPDIVKVFLDAGKVLEIVLHKILSFSQCKSVERLSPKALIP